MSYKSRKRKSVHTRILIILVLLITLALILGVLLFYFSATSRAGSNSLSADSSFRLPFSFAKQEAAAVPTSAPIEIPAETVPVPVTAATGNKADVACKASYTTDFSQEDASRVAATAGKLKLTNAQLQVFYLSEVNAYRNTDHAVSPDFTLPLDTQSCPLQEGVSWQHYFLQRAIRSWQAQQAAYNAAQQTQKIPEEIFEPLDYLHEEYVSADLPVNDFLYSDRPRFIPNELHQKYLNSIPLQLDVRSTDYGFENLDDMLEQVYGGGTTVEDFTNAATVYNTGYMYFTEKSYYVDIPEEDIRDYLTSHRDALDFEEGHTVELRHVLLVPSGAEVAGDGTVQATEAQWSKCKTDAEQMLQTWKWDFLTTRDKDSNFARLANQNSADEGSRINGGTYCEVKQGQLIDELDKWCFDSVRRKGDIEIIRSPLGYHILYLRDIHDNGSNAARQALAYDQEQDLWQGWMEQFPLTPDYSAVCLWADASVESVSLEETLYPDVAHERFPSAIVYLQQDYMYTPYGGSYVGRGGCGVTTMAMLATYMTDKIYSPGYLAGIYPEYHDESGTNGDMFRYVPAELGFYLERQSYQIEDAIQALENNQRVISLQVLGHFTRGGHYLLLQDYYKDSDTFQVRDSNIYNYGRLEGHKVDYFTRANIMSGSTGFYIMQEKVTRIPACDRCGTTFADRGPDALIQNYICEKCAAALERRSNFQTILDGFCS